MQGRWFFRCALPGSLAASRALVCVAALLGLFAATATPAQSVVERDVLLGLRSGHPRILADAAQLLAAASQADPVARQLRSIVGRDADAVIQAPAMDFSSSHGQTRGTGTLEVTRELQRRVLVLAMAHRLFGERRHADAAIGLLMQLSALDNWGTWHFLNIGEASMAAAVGYDWLFDAMTDGQRLTLRQAIIDKALLPSLEVKDEPDSWLRGNFNWNPVCHGGLLAAALAVADHTPDLARRIIERAVQSLPYAAAEYADGGAYPEGPSYWSYGTTYFVLAIEAMRSALGHSFGLERLPGFLQTGDYKLHMRGATGREYNHSDYHTDGIDEPVMLWFARETGRPALARLQVREAERIVEQRAHPSGASATTYSRFTPLSLLWWQRTMAHSAKQVALPLQWSASGALSMSVMRSAWDDPNATYLALKGGTADVSHGHMDVGGFLLEAQGVRWAVDPGTESYNRMRAAKLQLWRYAQDSTRWSTFRVGPEGHNILRFNGAAQRVAGKGQVSGLPPAADGTMAAAANLSSVYADQAASVQRRVRLRPDGSVEIEDVWTALPQTQTQTQKQKQTVSFQWLTEAAFKRVPGGFELQQAGRVLRVAVQPSAATIRFEDMSAPRASQDSPNPGLTRILIEQTTPAGAQGRVWLRATAQTTK